MATLQEAVNALNARINADIRDKSAVGSVTRAAVAALLKDILALAVDPSKFPVAAFQYFTAGTPVDGTTPYTMDLQALANDLAALSGASSGTLAAPGTPVSTTGKTSVPLSTSASTIDRYELETITN